MKTIYKIHILVISALSLLFFSCNDYLDRPPLSKITPEQYLNEESQLSAYSIARYNIFDTHSGYGFGIFEVDANTDNMVGLGIADKYVPGLWKVNEKDGDWNFTNIYEMNYFLDDVLPKYEAGKIQGIDSNIKHYIGEIYFLRAFEYFKKLQNVGDFPIITTPLADDKEILIEASKRSPRTEVARFILSDLDKAAELMKDESPDGKKNRLSKNCAYIMKSRVALFEGTWLKYFKGTAFVPNGTNWPGKSKDYNANYQFQSGSIDGEISFFLDEAMKSAKIVADNVILAENTGVLEFLGNENPYYNIFASTDLSGISEVLFWRQYDRGLKVTHNVPVQGQGNNNGVGLTRGQVDNYLMNNGLPIYAAGANYAGDDYISDVRKDRDGRLWLFLKEPGQKNTLKLTIGGGLAVLEEPYPIMSGGKRYSTGYSIRKGAPYDGDQCVNGEGYTACPIFRAAEAYLNYIEASYEKNTVIDADATKYWKEIRKRAKVDEDFNKTINATQMDKEALNDWAAYSDGNLISATLYNIRRERRSELLAEGFRYNDLRRWRAMDQLISKPYFIEGFKIWGPMKNEYSANDLKYGSDDAVVSDPTLSNYLRPHEIVKNSNGFQGSKWTMAHYLNPISAEHFRITSTGEPEDSPIYQNPNWGLQGGTGPQ